MIEYLNHNLIMSPVGGYISDLVCTNCGVRLEPVIKNNIRSYDLITGINFNKAKSFYNLTCEEQIIKNLLE